MPNARRVLPLDLLSEGDADDMGPGAFNPQDLIDSGLAWRLEGSIGRECMRAIESGACMLGPKPVRDYWGNLVPAWWMVDAGSKGSPEYADRERPEEPSADQQRRMLRAVGITLPRED